MTGDDKQWVVDTIKIAILTQRKEMMEEDIPVALIAHEKGCLWGRKLTLLIGVLIGSNALSALGAAVLTKFVL